MTEPIFEVISEISKGLNKYIQVMKMVTEDGVIRAGISEGVKYKGKDGVEVRRAIKGIYFKAEQVGQVIGGLMKAIRPAGAVGQGGVNPL